MHEQANVKAGAPESVNHGNSHLVPVSEIPEHDAMRIAGYDTGLKWDAEDNLRPGMMNKPGLSRFRNVTLDQVCAKASRLGCGRTT